MNHDKRSSEPNTDSVEGTLAEVEIYLAYQMAEQAIAVLEEALADGSGGLEHRVRLIEIYAAEGNMESAREHGKVALGQIGPKDEALRSRILAVDPEWSVFQPSVAEAKDAGAAELALLEEPEPTDSGEADAPPAENLFASEDAPAGEQAADIDSEPSGSVLESQPLDDQGSRRSWRVPFIALGVLAGLAVVFVLAIERFPVEAPPVAGLPESPVHGEAIVAEADDDAAGRAAKDDAVESLTPEFSKTEHVAGQVFFREDSTEVDARFGGLLDDVADTLASNPGAFAAVVGYPGRAKEAEFDKAFARHFAWAVANQLIQRGVAPDHMRVEARTGADLAMDGWVVGDYDGLVVIHLGGVSNEALR